MGLHRAPPRGGQGPCQVGSPISPGQRRLSRRIHAFASCRGLSAWTAFCLRSEGLRRMRTRRHRACCALAFSVWGCGARASRITRASAASSSSPAVRGSPMSPHRRPPPPLPLGAPATPPRSTRGTLQGRRTFGVPPPPRAADLHDAGEATSTKGRSNGEVSMQLMLGTSPPWGGSSLPTSLRAPRGLGVGDM